MSRFYFLLAVVALASAPSAQPSAPGAWEPTFAVPGVYDFARGDAQGQVSAIAEAGDLLCVGGVFALIDFTPISNVACWDGTAWTALGGGTQGAVRALAFGPAGTLVVGGTFSHVLQPGGAELEVNGVAEWTGSAWRALGSGLGNDPADPRPVEVAALAAAPDGGLIVGGTFTRALLTDETVTEAAGLVRWTGTGWEPLGDVYAVGVQALAFDEAGLLYAGGQFFGSDALPSEGTGGVARWNGAAWAPLGQGVGDGVFAYVSALAPAPGGGVFVGGRFEAVSQSDGSAVRSRNVARWDGTQWTALGGGLTGTDGIVQSFAIAADGMYVGGDFTGAVQPSGDVIPARHLARWTGSGWEEAAAFENAYYGIQALTARADGSLLVGGSFASVAAPSGEPLPVSGLAELQADGRWAPITAISTRNGLNDFVTDLVADGCGSLFASGYFTAAGSLAANHLARWDGTEWSPLGSGVSGTVSVCYNDSTPTALAALGCGDVVVSGRFRTAHQPDGSEVTVNGIARWTGAQWEPLGGGTNGSVTALATDGDGVYVGGRFTEVYQPDGTAVQVRNLARWTGTAWEALGGIGATGETGVCNIPVSAIAPAPDGTLYVGGYFDEAFQSDGTAVSVRDVAQWTGTDWRPLGGGITPGFYTEVFALLLDPDDGLYVGGYFESVDQPDGSALSARGIARWTGTTWESLGDGVRYESVGSLALADQGIYASGAFSHVVQPDGSLLEVDGIARWDGTMWASLDEGLAFGGAGALAVQSDGRLVVGGGFGGPVGIPSPYLAVWNPAATTPTEDTPTAPDAFALDAYPQPVHCARHGPLRAAERRARYPPRLSTSSAARSPCSPTRTSQPGRTTWPSTRARCRAGSTSSDSRRRRASRRESSCSCGSLRRTGSAPAPARSSACRWR